MKSLEQLLSELKSNNKKIAIIIGAGFHCQFIENHIPIYNKLKNWNCLLDWLKTELSCNFESSSNSILDFEKIIMSQNAKNDFQKSAKEIESNIIGKLVREIKSITLLNEADTNNSMLSVFNNAYVSDVINLNFDLLIEKKYADYTKTKNWKKVKDSTSELNNKQSRFGFQYRSINNIKFWHPHGDYTNMNSIVLGLRRYGLQLNNLESYRKTFKKRINIDQKNFVEKNWMEVIMNKPILVLGASLSSNEQDILFALINKKRNFIKSNPESLDSRSIIFHMVDKYKTSSLGDFAIPLYPNLDFQSQWPKLVKLLSKK